MIEIKVRAWDDANKRMMYKGLLDHNWYGTPVNDYRCHTIRPAAPEDKVRLIIMLRTGLVDVNGKRIYTGDIVTMHQFLFDGNEIESQIGGVISWGLYGLTLAQIRNKSVEEYSGYDAGEGEIALDSFYGLHDETWEIIGNQHENPEMLEAKP